jgi:hypothetical protein
MAASGEFFGRNMRDAPASGSESEDDGDGNGVGENNKNNRFYPTREAEDSALDAFVAELRAEAQAEPNDDDGGYAKELAAFERRLLEEIRKGENPIVNKAFATRNGGKPKEPYVMHWKKLRDRVTTLASANRGRIPWDYSGGGGGQTLPDAEDKVIQLEAAIAKPVAPTAQGIALVFWNAALRPPWPLLGPAGDKTRPVPLGKLCALLEEHFGFACAALTPLSPPGATHRVALLVNYNMEEVGRGLAFILSGVSAEARAFTANSADDIQIISLADILSATKDAATWAYVGTTPVSLRLVHAAKSHR